MRAQLLPGIHVLRRRDAQLQVGLDRRRAVVLPDTEQVRRGLDALTARSDRPAADGDVLRAVAPLLQRPRQARAAQLAVRAFGHPVGAALVGRLSALLCQAGHDVGSREPDLVLLIGVGEPDRALVDGYGIAGVAHLVVRLVEGHAVVGPFVAPRATACLRCIDAHATDEDPSWPLLLHQYVELCSRDRRDGASEPVDPILADLACAWAARDAATYLEGHRPSTWSATIRIDPRLHALETREWQRHPDCGCGWS